MNKNKGKSRQLYQNIIWRSRRGMLELDLLLSPFVKEVYADLPVDLQTSYQQLLECEDTELYQWLALAQEPVADFSAIVARIRLYGQQSAH